MHNCEKINRANLDILKTTLSTRKQAATKKATGREPVAFYKEVRKDALHDTETKYKATHPDY